jgi:hypothetical protein
VPEILAPFLCDSLRSPVLAAVVNSGAETRIADQVFYRWETLDSVAQMLTNSSAEALTCNWAAVRYQYTAAVRTKLAEAYEPSTTNKMLSALQCVLKEAWKLGYLSAEDYQRSASVAGVTGETLPAGRELS